MTDSHLDDLQVRCCSGSSALNDGTDKVNCACEVRAGKRKYLESSMDLSNSNESHPINEILLWHKAIMGELNEIAKEAKEIQISGDFTNLSAFNERLQFIAEVCIFHRYPFYYSVKLSD